MSVVVVVGTPLEGGVVAGMSVSVFGAPQGRLIFFSD